MARACHRDAAHPWGQTKCEEVFETGGGWGRSCLVVLRPPGMGDVITCHSREWILWYNILSVVSNHTIDELAMVRLSKMNERFDGGPPQVTRRDLCTLKHNTWINDEVVNLYIQGIQLTSRLRIHAFSRYHPYNTVSLLFKEPIGFIRVSLDWDEGGGDLLQLFLD